jgi:hypothetical protein
MSHTTAFHRWLSSIAPARRERTLGPARRRAARRPLILEPLEDRTVLSVSLVVSSLADSGTGTLRDAINTADADTSQPYLIDFAVTGAINLTTGTLSLTGNDNGIEIPDRITIQGPGAGSLTVQRATNSPFGIFSIASGMTVNISGLTIANGASPGSGGGINDAGALTVTNCTFDNNSTSVDGGAVSVSSEAYAAITNCTFDNNSTSVDGGAISISSNAITTILNSTLDNNSAVRGAGGGILIAGYATITNCTLDNDAARSGGGIDIDNHGVASITNCALDNNSARDSGGGIDNIGVLTVTNSTLANNFTFGPGGGIASTGTLTVTNCTLDSDSADLSEGGGIYTHGTGTVTNCTFANDSSFFGGGISNEGTATVTNSTLAYNSADAMGGGIFNDGTVMTFDTIIAGNTTGGVFRDVDGTLASQGHNLIGNTSGGDGFAASDRLNLNPLLAPLGNYGGPTQTIALLPGSPAIDAGDNTNVPPTDQRGFNRIVGGTIDIGAFESRGFSIALTSGNGQSATVATSFLNPLVVTVTSPYGDPVQGGVVTVTAPAGGAGAIFGGATNTTTATINPAGQAGVAASANAVAGSYGVTVSAEGASFPAGFNLTNTPGAASQIRALAGTPQGTTVGYAFAAPLAVTVTDQYGNAVPGVSVTYAAPAIGPGGTIGGGNVVTTNAQGIAAPTFQANTVAGGPYTVTATVGGLSGNFSLTNRSDVARVFAVSGFPSPTTAGAAHSFTVTAQDRFGNVATGYSGMVHFTSTDPEAVLPPGATLASGMGTFSATLKTAGTPSLTAFDSLTTSLTGSQSAITVNPAAASALLIKAPATIAPGVPFGFTVTAVDAYGNVATGYSGTIKFASNKKATLPTYSLLTGGMGTFTATFNGPENSNQTLTATDLATPSLTATATIFVDPPVRRHQRIHFRGGRK